MKKEKVTLDNFTQDLYDAREIVRKFNFAFNGTPEKDVKNFRAAKKKIAQLLTLKKRSQ